MDDTARVEESGWFSKRQDCWQLTPNKITQKQDSESHDNSYEDGDWMNECVTYLYLIRWFFYACFQIVKKEERGLFLSERGCILF